MVKPITSGRRRHQGVFSIRDTGANNFNKAVRDENKRRELLNNEFSSIRPTEPKQRRRRKPWSEETSKPDERRNDQ